MKLRVLELAEKELIDAAKWYSRRQSGLGEDLIAEYYLNLQEIEHNPLSFAHLETVSDKYDIRRCILKRFSYLIIYEILEHEIVVLSFAHSSRKPNYWRRRRRG